MVFVPTTNVGREVQQALRGAGCDLPLYHGKLPANEREVLLGRFSGRLDPPLNAVICTSAFSMALTCPTCEQSSTGNTRPITIRHEHPETELVVAFADQAASAYATGGGWVAQALRTWKVQVEVVEIPPELREELLAAQSKQRMVNADQATGDVALDA